MLAVQGPEARAALEALADGDLPARMRTAELTRRRRRAASSAAPATPARTASSCWSPGRRRGGLGRARRAGRRARRAWARATRSASRSASTSTATTCRRTATRSRPGSAGAASSTPASSARRRCASRASPWRRWCRSPSPAPGSRARATRCAPRPGRGGDERDDVAVPRERNRHGVRSSGGGRAGTPIEVDVRGKPRAAEVAREAAVQKAPKGTPEQLSGAKLAASYPTS